MFRLDKSTWDIYQEEEEEWELKLWLMNPSLLLFWKDVLLCLIIITQNVPQTCFAREEA